MSNFSTPNTLTILSSDTTVLLEYLQYDQLVYALLKLTYVYVQNKLHNLNKLFVKLKTAMFDISRNPPFPHNYGCKK